MDSIQLWQEVYGPRWQGMQARESALREQAFIDWRADVLGEALRPITLRDMFLLHGAGNPYIAGGAYPEPGDVLQFLWMLNAENRGGRLRRWWQRRRMIRRVALRAVEGEGDAMDVWTRAINAYLDDVFIDAPKRSAKDDRPLGVCFVAPMLVRVSHYVGNVDPASGKGWMDTPIARIFQYIKAMNRAELGKEFKDFSPSDKVMSDWLDHSNRNAAMKAGGA